jgi:hypothetical protein
MTMTAAQRVVITAQWRDPAFVIRIFSGSTNNAATSAGTGIACKGNDGGVSVK